MKSLRSKPSTIKIPGKGEIVTFLKGDDGRVHPVSRMGDRMLDFSSHIDNPAALTTKIDLEWYPSRWRRSVSEFLVVYWKYGRPGFPLPKGATVVGLGIRLVAFVQFVDSLGVGSFQAVRPIHIAAYVKHLQKSLITSRVRKGLPRTAMGMRGSLNAITMVWTIRKGLRDYITFPPFENAGSISRLIKHSRSGPRRVVTGEISEENLSKLLRICEEVLSDTGETIHQYECLRLWKIKNPPGKMPTSTYQLRMAQYAESMGIGGWAQLNARVTLIRAACYTEIAMLVGQRVSEVLLLETDCLRLRTVNGEKIIYLRGQTLKGKKSGEIAEWVAPSRIVEVVKILKNVSEVDRSWAKKNLKALKDQLSNSSSERTSAAILMKIRKVEKGIKALFLVEQRMHGRKSFSFLGTAGSHAVSSWIKAVKKEARVTAKVTPHMFRRTFATTVVNACNGDLRYLRKHFQHWSIETTAMYASSERRDQEMVDDIAKSMLDYKASLVHHFLLPETRLAGKGGLHIMAMKRSYKLAGRTAKEKAEVVRRLADTLVIRPTGHSDCLASPLPTCGGRGLYDARACSECDDAVIREAHAEVYAGLGAQALELLALDDVGPGGRQAIERSLGHFRTILQTFGLSLDDQNDRVILSRSHA